MTRPPFGIGLSRLCGGAAALFDSAPSGIAGFLAKPREPWKGVLSTCKFVSATRLCNVFASKSPRICRSGADISSNVLFFESLSVLKCPGRMPAWHLRMLVASGAGNVVREYSSVARVPALGVGHARISLAAEKHARSHPPQECSVAVLVTVFHFAMAHRTAQEGHAGV